MNKWDDDDSTEHVKNCSNCNGPDQNDITTETKHDSVTSKCNDTGNVWIRNCPKCGKIITYNRRCNYLKGCRENGRCKSCAAHDAAINRPPPTKIARMNMSKAQFGRKHSEETLSKMRGVNNGMFGIFRCGKDNPFYGRKHTEEARRKMRVAMCRKIVQKNSETGRIANVNPRETLYFWKLENRMGWNGVFYGKNPSQYLIEAIGYFVDYYEPTLNIVVEYDEPRHYRRGGLRQRDVTRMHTIQRQLNCRFLRYNEKTDELLEYDTENGFSKIDNSAS